MPHQTVDEIVELLDAVRADDEHATPVVRAAPEAYRAMSRDVLRQTHAHQTAERPRGLAAYRHEGGVMRLWSREGPGGAPWVALATSVNSTRAGCVVNAGYRVLCESDDEAATLAGDPGRALATLLTRFGVSYYTGRRRVYFVPEHLVELSGRLESHGPDQFARAVGLETPPDGSMVAVNVAVSAADGGMTRLSWLFVLDLTRYEEHTRPRGR